MDAGTLATLSRAVAEDVPARYVRVIDADIAEDGRAAVVLVLLNPDDEPYPMISFCEFYDSGWVELVLTDLDEAGDAASTWTAGRWVSYVSGAAPDGARAVRVRQAAKTKRRAVVEGLFVVAFWFPPEDSEPTADDDAPDPPAVLDFDY